MTIEVRDSKQTWALLLRTYIRPRRPRRGPQRLPEPVAPNSPKHLSGGAAAALDFGE